MTEKSPRYSGVRLELTSADIPGTLTELERMGMEMQRVDYVDGLTVSMSVPRRQLADMAQYCGKRGLTVRILGVRGLYWSLRALLRRPVLLAGLALLLFFTVWVPEHIFFVQVEGNTTVPTALILENAAKNGVEFGVSAQSIRSEQVKNGLLQAVPQLQWAGINIRGCVAVISVRERAGQELTEQRMQVSSLVAARDGVIRSITVLSGTALCGVGDRVRAGDVLISGYTDCGLLIRADCAQGEVFAETSRSAAAISPVIFQERGELLRSERKISIIIGKKRINFDNSSGILGGDCVRIYSEKYVTLPGGYQLPVGIIVESCTYYQTQPRAQPVSEAALAAFAEDYLLEDMIAGRIEASTHAFSQTEYLCRIDSLFACVEMIGIIRAEERLENYENRGKNG